MINLYLKVEHSLSFVCNLPALYCGFITVAPWYLRMAYARQTVLLGQQSPLWCQAPGAPAAIITYRCFTKQHRCDLQCDILRRQWTLHLCCKKTSLVQLPWQY